MSASRSRTSSTQCYAGVILLRSDDAALLQQRDDRSDVRHPGRWVNPGGRCRSGETDEDCARRELLEETGYQCGPLLLVGNFVDDFGPRWPRAAVTVYCARYDGRQDVRCLEGRAMIFVERSRAIELNMIDPLVDLWDRAIESLRAIDSQRTHS